MRPTPRSGSHGYNGFLRARPGTTRERLAAEMAGVMAGVAQQFPATSSATAYVVHPLVESIVGDLRPTLIVALAGALLLMLLASVNVTNLLLARGAVRAQEIAIRAALGASRLRIVRQLLVESLVLSATGTAAGLLGAFGGVRLLQRLGASTLPRLESVPFDGRVIAFAMAAMIATTILIGLVPSMRLVRAETGGVLAEPGRAVTSSRGTRRLLSTMIVAEITVAIALVAGAGWLVRNFANLSNASTGFTADGRVVFNVYLSGARYAQPESVASWWATLDERLRALPGVTAVGASSMTPLAPERDVSYYVATNADPDSARLESTARMRSAGPGFFRAMGVRMTEGRELTADDRPRNVAVVNRAFVQRYLGGRDPLTEPFYYGFPKVDRTTPYRIVGVTDDVKYASLGEPPEPTFYLPDSEPQQTVVVATSLQDPASLVAAIRGAVQSVDPTLVVAPESMPQIVAKSLSRQRLGVVLMTMFAAAALALAAIGIYGVITYASTARLREIATRMAIGGAPSDVFWMLVHEGRTVAAIGTALGVAAAYAGGRVVSNRLYEVRALDPLILTSAVGSVLAIAFVAIVVPARRASKVDVAATLRLE
jgi:predicted permease